MVATPPRFSLCVALTLLFAPLAAQDWPNWRGPNYDGSTSVVGLPADFDKEVSVRWTAPMPGPGASTPIVVGDRIYLTSVDTERDRLVGMCIDRNTGEVVWAKDAGSGFGTTEGGSRVTRGGRSNFASPSAVTDGKHVVFFFGNGDLVGFDPAGEELWRRNIQEEYGKFAFNWTFSSTPTIWDGTLFLPVMQRDVPVRQRRGGFRRGGGRGGPGEGGRRRGGRGGERGERGRPPRGEGGPPADPQPEGDIESFVLAVDPASGKTIYKKARPSPARMESREAYSTPIPYVNADGRKELIIVGGDVLTGHDPATGDELWRWGTWNEAHRQRAWRLVPSAVVGGGVAIVCAPKRAPVFAIKLGGTGELDDGALAWQSSGRPNPVSSDVPTPAFHDGHFFVLSDMQNALSKVRAKDGEVAWTTKLSRDFLWRASPTVADGRVWCINHGGEVVVVDAASGEIVHQVMMGNEDDDRIRASIVAAHGNLYIRTNDTLFCIGE